MNALKIRAIDFVAPSPLIVSFVVGLLLGVIEFGVFMNIPLVALVWIYVLWITPNYLFETVEFKALGNEGWPVFSLETLVAGRNQIGVAFTVIMLVTAGSYATLRYTGRNTIAEILLGAGLIVYPASVALLAVTRRLPAAVNPMRVASTAAGMGVAYLYCLLGSMAVFTLFQIARTRGGLWYFPLIYGLFLHAWLIGLVVYARRNALGVNAPRSPEARAQRARDELLAVRQGVLNHAYGFAAHDNFAGALKHLEAYIATEEDTLEARLWILNEVTRWGSSNFTLAFAGRVIDYCEQHGFAGEAVKVRVKCEQLNEHTRRGKVS